MKTKQSKLGKKLLSLTIMLTTLLTLFAPASYAQDYYPPGQHWIPVGLISGINFAAINRPTWTNSSDSTIEFVHSTIFGELRKSGNLNQTGAVFRHAQLREASEKGLLSYNRLRVAGNGWVNPHTWGTSFITAWSDRRITSAEISIPADYVKNYQTREYENGNKVDWFTNPNNGSNQSVYCAFSINIELGESGRLFTSGVYNSQPSKWFTASVTHVLVNIAPDTTAIGRVETTVQSIPTTLNNTVNQINTSLANQPLALVYIPNNAQRTTQLAKLGLATNLTVDDIYKSSDGFKYKVVFYTPTSSVDQLNLT